MFVWSNLLIHESLRNITFLLIVYTERPISMMTGVGGERFLATPPQFWSSILFGICPIVQHFFFFSTSVTLM